MLRFMNNSYDFYKRFIIYVYMCVCVCLCIWCTSEEAHVGNFLKIVFEFIFVFGSCLLKSMIRDHFILIIKILNYYIESCYTFSAGTRTMHSIIMTNIIIIRIKILNLLMSHFLANILDTNFLFLLMPLYVFLY